jgi:hypothetical protein
MSKFWKIKQNCLADGQRQKDGQLSVVSKPTYFNVVKTAQQYARNKQITHSALQVSLYLTFGLLLNVSSIVCGCPQANTKLQTLHTNMQRHTF